MKLRIFLVTLAGCLMLSACGTAKAPEDAAAVPTEAPESTETAAPAETPASAAAENRYARWESYNDYVYTLDGQPKYWIEFDGEFYLHCMFRSGDPEPYEAVYTLYPDWDGAAAQELTIRTVKDAEGRDVSHWFASLSFDFSSGDQVRMEVVRDESTLAGGAGDNILTGRYVLLPRGDSLREPTAEESAAWYGEDALLQTKFVDNGDEARSFMELTLSAGDETVTGFLEGAYDVLSVERQPDGYVIGYTYGDFYSHDAVRSSRVTVENGEMVITELPQ